MGNFRVGSLMVFVCLVSSCVWSSGVVQNWPEAFHVPPGTRVSTSFVDADGRQDEFSIPSHVVKSVSESWLLNERYVPVADPGRADLLIVFSSAFEKQLRTRSVSSSQLLGSWYWSSQSTATVGEQDIPYMHGEIFLQQPHRHPRLIARGSIRLYYDGFLDNREMANAVSTFLDKSFLSTNEGQEDVSEPFSLGYDPKERYPHDLGCWPRYQFSAIRRDGLTAITSGLDGGVKAGDRIIAIGGQPADVGISIERQDGESVEITVIRDGETINVRETLKESCGKIRQH